MHATGRYPRPAFHPRRVQKRVTLLWRGLQCRSRILPTPPRTPRPGKPEIHPLSPDQARKLIETAYSTGNRYAALYALALHTGLREGEKLRLGSLWQDNGLVFPTTTGATRSGTNLLGRYFRPMLKSADLPPARLHDLRHTCATILLMAGKHPKYVQELLGHASITITLDTYSHVIEGVDGGLADAMDEAL